MASAAEARRRYLVGRLLELSDSATWTLVFGFERGDLDGADIDELITAKMVTRVGGSPCRTRLGLEVSVLGRHLHDAQEAADAS